MRYTPQAAPVAPPYWTGISAGLLYTSIPSTLLARTNASNAPKGSRTPPRSTTVPSR